MNKTYTFVEPHITGGDCTVVITEKQIMIYMKERQAADVRMKDISDEDLLDYFLVNHWCVETPPKPDSGGWG